MDVEYLMAAFEELNSCTLSALFSLERKGGKSQLAVEMIAFTRVVAPAEPVALGSVQSSLSALNTLSMEAAIMHCLYLIDAQLARKEMGIDPPK
jgi:hypothetical protein